MSMEPWAAVKNVYSNVVRQPAPDHLPRMSVKLCLSANNKDVNEVKSAAVHRSPGIYVMTEEKPGNLRLRESDKFVRAVIASNRVP